MAKQYIREVSLNVYAGSTLTVIKDLVISFDVKASRSSKPNTAKVEIENLNDRYRALFDEQHQAIELFAGYKGNSAMIHRGTTTNVNSVQIPTGWMTTIWSGEGQKEFDLTYFSKAYTRGTPVTTVISDIASAMGLPFELDTVQIVATLGAGAVFESQARKALDVVTKDHGLTWSIQHGVLEVIKKGEPPIKDSTAILLTPRTGLILPGPSIAQRTEGKKKISYVKGSAQLNPAIRPSRLIKIDGAVTSIEVSDAFKKRLAKRENANGVYIVDRVHKIGDNKKGPFVTKFEADKR